MNTNVLLSINKLSVSFSHNNNTIVAVDGVNFSISPKEIVGIVGESGSGKSMSMLGGIRLLPSHAQCTIKSIEFNGIPITKYTNKQMRTLWGKEISYISQEPSQSYDPLVNIYATFKELFLAHNPKITKNEILERSISLLKEVGIDQAEERIKSYFHQFSGGMIQRVQIALALALNPKLLIADEPTTALDVTTQQRIIHLLLELCKKRHMAMVFITHDLALVSSLVDKIIVMKNGKIVESGTPNNILYYPKHPHTKTLLDSTIKFGDRYDR